MREIKSAKFEKRGRDKNAMLGRSSSSCVVEVIIFRVKGSIFFDEKETFIVCMR